MNRRRLIAWSGLPVVAALVSGSALLARSATTQLGVGELGTDSAPSWFARSDRIAVGERDLPPFNEGVAWLHVGELGRARAAFSRALRRSDDEHRCRVVVNLGLTMELQAIVVAEQDEVAAQEFFAEAKDLVLGNAPCLERTTPAGDGEGDRLARLLARLDERLQEGGRQLDDNLIANRESATRTPDDPISELDRRLDDNAETRTRGRELEEDVTLERSGSEGPRW